MYYVHTSGRRKACHGRLESTIIIANFWMCCPVLGLGAVCLCLLVRFTRVRGSRGSAMAR